MYSPIIYANVDNQVNRLRIHSPGRINLIGEHTDYNNGFVLPAAIDRVIWMSAVKNDKAFITASSIDFEQRIQFPISIEQINSTGWERYFQAVVIELKNRGYTPPGIYIYFVSDLAIGAGISSSAALICGFLFALNELAGWQLSKMEMAHIAQAAEHLTGVDCGIMDMFAILHGKKEHAVLLDCSDLSYQYIPFKLKDYRIVLINSMIKHELANSKYNERRGQCESALNTIREDFPTFNNLRETEPVLPQYQTSLNGSYQKVKFVVEENRRVADAANALQKGKLKEVGELLYQSHWGLSRQYEVSCAELDLLVETASNTKGVAGARMMGGGFGGCTINLIHEKYLYQAIKTISVAYISQAGVEPSVYEVKIGDSIQRISGAAA